MPDTLPETAAPAGSPDAPAPPAAAPISRSLRLGVAGPVGTGKSSLIALVCRELASELRLGVVTNDIYTDEDARFLRSAGVLDPARIRAVETGACPHTAIRDDVTANLLAVEDLESDFAPLDVVLVESGGDNLTATFSPALVDAQIFVLDVAGGGDVARKGGPGIARADLLVVNKTDLGPYVGVDVPRMVADATAARDGRPVLALSRLDRGSIDALTDWVRGVLRAFRGGRHVAVDPGPMAPHFHADAAGATRRARRRPRAQPRRRHRWARPRVTRIGVAAATGRARLALAETALSPRVIAVTESGARVALVATRALLLGGDHVVVDIDVGAGAWLRIDENAGTVAYDAGGTASSWSVRVRVAAGGTLTWFGQPFVVSDGAAVTRSLGIDLDPGGLAVVRDTLVLGRSGERGGALATSTRVRLGGTELLAEDLDLTDQTGRRFPGILGAARVLDTVAVLGARAPRAELPATVHRYDLAGDGTIARALAGGTGDPALDRLMTAWSGHVRRS